MMTLLEIYRLAIVEELTAAEAGLKYSCSKQSLSKIGCRYKMPRLKTEAEKRIQRQLSLMNDTQILSYHNALNLTKNARTSQREKLAVVEELSRRGIDVK